ncbi:MAG: hypothetical protein N3G21_12605 [Candidatus Hydrogenedentes bacterium]|nr:hypothetical protein [Candidatus Hydrogenedentota bacterium]
MRKVITILLVVLIGGIIGILPFTPIWRKLPFSNNFNIQQFPVITNSEINIYFPDFPFLWNELSTHPIGVSAYNNLYKYIYNVELIFRKCFGIRPTPIRWDFWLGREAVLSYSSDSGHWAVITKPRVYSCFILSKLLEEELKFLDDKKIYISFNESYLIFSNFKLGPDDLRYCSFSSPEREGCSVNIALDDYSVVLYPTLREVIEIEGRLESNNKYNASLRPPYFSNSILSISGELLGLVKEISLRNYRCIMEGNKTKSLTLPLELYLNTIKGSPVERLGWKLLGLAISQGGIIAIAGLSGDYSTPIPVIAGWLPLSEDELQKIREVLDIPEYSAVHNVVWSNLEGYIIPIWGRAYQLCLARYRNGFIFCSDESTMNTLINSLDEQDAFSSYLSIDFPSLAKFYGRFFRWAVSLEASPFLSERDVSELYPSWEKFFESLGTLEIKIFEDVNSNKMLIQGKLGNRK